VSKIPGLPTKEQALKTVGEFLKKSPKDFEKGVDEIINVMKSIPMTGLTAFDIKGLTRNLKIITNPQIVLAIIALMAMFQTADAGVLRDKIRGR